jgi:DNA polymerase-1
VGEILRDILTHPKANIVFQNGAFDLQYFAKQMGFLPKCHNDTMLMQHTLFPGLKKALDYLASLYCHYYVYWKDDGKFWLKDIPEDEQWYYNCEDCVYTYECFEVLDGLIDRMKMRDQYSFQMELFHVAVEMMMRGIRVDLGRKAQVARDLERVKDQTQKWVNTAVGYPINMDSPKQMQELFYHEFMVPPVKNRQTGNPTTDDEALKTIARRQPLLKPLTDKVAEYRSLRVFKSNFADATVSEDNRARCSINLAGAETFRFSASADAFGDGCNMQTLPKGTEDD